jgi:uncharacterized protein (DUF1778 family)
MPRDRSRISHIEVPIAPGVLALVKRAADIQGRSVSDFMVAAAHAAAHRTIEEAQIIRLAAEDQRALAEAALNPPAPASALVRGAKTYRALVKASR